MMLVLLALSLCAGSLAALLIWRLDQREPIPTLQWVAITGAVWVAGKSIDHIITLL